MNSYNKSITGAMFSMTVLFAGLTLNGCGNEVLSESSSQITDEITGSEPSSQFTDEAADAEPSSGETADADTTIVPLKGINATQSGPYGELSLSIPDGWLYEAYPMDSGQLMQGMYGIHFYPEGVSDGYIELAYIDRFGVCGTGLEEKADTLAGNSVNVGTYDNHDYWDFITFGDACEGVVALTYSVEPWWDAYRDQVWEILDTTLFDASAREGGACIYSADSEAEEIGVYFTLKNITPVGATMVFRQYDAQAPTGELITGDAYVLEVLKNDTWEEAPIVLEGNYAFTAIGYMIDSGETFEQEFRWEWLYGALAPGSYRIQKEILDCRAPGDFDQYVVYVQFILN